MSKHLKEVFANMFQVSLLETIQPEPCNVKGSMDIIVEEVDDDGTPCMTQATRYVKVCHSQNECVHYEINVDPQSGIGKITLDDIEAMTYRIAQVDECGMQMISQDAYEITYMVNDEVMEEDYAEINFAQGEHATLRIVNRRMPKANLTVQKRLRDRYGKAMDICDDMEFRICLSRNDGFERFIKLNKDNEFCVCLQDLPSGLYTIEEYEYCDFMPFYQFNDQCETSSTLFELNPGNNTLTIMNEERINTQLSISKYVRNACGELCKPSCFDEFEVSVISDEQEERVVLCEENDFCVTLYGLTPGFYDVRENSDQCRYDTTYIVDGGDESRNAVFEICEGNANEVWIINTNTENDSCQDQSAPLRICKYVRRSDGCIVKPDDALQFTVTVCGCGLNESFYLNAGNNFCIDLASLCAGEYEICEVGCHDFITSYSINGECEKTSACICYDGSQNFCVSIINEERNRGSIRICKYIRNAYGDLIRPNHQQCFDVTLTSYFTKRCFQLNAENDFCVCFDDLRFGSYEIREETNDEYQTSYQVNCGKEKPFARILVDNCCDNEVKIINSVYQTNCGILKIAKFIETTSRELVKPSRDEEFEINVKGENFCENYILRASNNWCIQLEGLSNGEYCIQECGKDAYDVDYLVNKERMEEAVVCMDNGNQEVSIINRLRNSGNLRIDARIRGCDGCERKPDPSLSFEVLVESKTDSCCVCLQADNNWCVELDELCEGKYRIIQKDNMGFKVSYITQGREESFGKVRLGSQDESITIINEESDCVGNLIVTKYMMDENGDMCMPNAMDEFHFELKSRCFTHTYTLRNRNDFCVYFDDLEEGHYTICELDEGFDVSYRINGECVDCADFMLGRDDVYVDVINREKQSAMLHVEKCIQRANHLTAPDECDHFQFLLKGKNMHEIYDLNADNDFCVDICNLCNQHYEVKELNANANVRYEVNRLVQKDGYFLFDDDNVMVRIINDEVLLGCMQINKVVMDEDGRWLSPQRDECFEVLVESENFKQKVILSHENDFCVHLYDLPQGHYEIKELNAQCVSYMINNQPYTTACVDVSEEDVCITIINQPCNKGSLHICGIVEERGYRRELLKNECIELQVSDEGFCENVVLNSEGSCSCLSDLAKGMYHITSGNDQSLSFEIENRCFHDDVCIDLNGEDVEILAVLHPSTQANITIKKCMLDSKGNSTVPTKDACFHFQLKGNDLCKDIDLSASNQFMVRIENVANGDYELVEMDEGNVRFQIDQQDMQDDGVFHVHDEDVCITAYNQSVAYANLHLESCIECCDGRIVRPCADEVFYMDIQGDTTKTIRLDKKNAWHETIELKEGSYQVTQQEAQGYCGTHYMLNDSNVEAIQIDMFDEDVYVSALNIECCAKGSIEICKLIRDEEGCYRYPCADESFTILVLHGNEQQRITLNQENHFRTSLRNLKDGVYEIREEQGREGVAYIVNNAVPTTSGIVCVAGNANTVNIINPTTSNAHPGSIALSKYIANEQGLLSKPQNGNYRIHISKPGFNEVFYLSKENRFQYLVEDLEDGLYVVDELDHENTRYIVNGGNEVAQAVVEVKGNSNQVDIINPAQTLLKGSMTLAKYIRENNQLMRPSKDASYVFLISRPGFHQLITLDQSNQWMYTLENLEDGDYVISETTNTDDVSFIINGGSEVDRGIVSIAANSNTVQIINTKKNVQGVLNIRKLIRNEQGELITPKDDVSISVRISSPGFHKIITLDQNNSWSYALQVDPGMYVINELDSDMRVTYIIDGGSEVDRGIVNVNSDTHQIDMINHAAAHTKGSIHIEKYVRENMRVRRPQGDFSTQVFVSRPGFQKVYTLDASNDWMVDITDLENGLYVLDEVGNTHKVTYIINGGSEVSNGVVTVENNANMVMMIDTITQPSNSIQIAKFIRDSDGSLITPQSDQSFQVEIRRDNQFVTSVTLNRDNQFQTTLKDLKNGYYDIQEVSNLDYSISYIIDNGLETANASIRLLNNAHTVSIINSHATTLGRLEIRKLIKNADGTLIPPADGDQYFVQVANDTILRRIQLDSGNNFTAVLQDLPQGEYRILEVDSLAYLTTYRINGGPEQFNASVTMASGVNNLVEVINELRGNRNTIEVFKYFLDNDGNYLPPVAPNVYSFTIIGLDNGIQETYELNVNNSWHQSLRTLPSGRYQVKENGTSPYPIKYLVNSAELVNEAIFTIAPGATIVIGIINTMINDGMGSLTLSKRIRGVNGNLFVPVNGEIFTVNVSGNGSNEIVTLEPENNYTFTLANIAFGVYTVEEVTSDYNVTYRVNEGVETNEGVVNINATASNTVLIINTPNVIGTPQNNNDIINNEPDNTVSNTASQQIKVVIE